MPASLPKLLKKLGELFRIIFCRALFLPQERLNYVVIPLHESAALWQVRNN